MNKRILLFTGKGGVGKTTCAAATALKAANEGKKVLVLSSDPAHSLADALDHKLGAEPQRITDNLDAMEVDLYYSMKKYWANLRDMLLSVFKWQGINSIAAEELASLPGMGEASTLLWLDVFYHESDYDLIVIDAAPTGETLTLLSLPQVMQWWFSKAFPFQKTTMQTFGALVRNVTGVPVDHGFKELDAIFGKLEKMQKILADPSITSMRLVANPERMVINEAQRAYTYLQLYGYNVDSIIVNRILPQTTSKSWAKYLESQAKYMKEIEDKFTPLPILKVPHIGEEVFGLERLAQIGDALYKEQNPMDVFHTEANYKIAPHAEAYRLTLNLPFLESEATVQQFGDELVIQVANQRRNFFLPQFLSYYHITKTKMDDGVLHIDFGKD